MSFASPVWLVGLLLLPVLLWAYTAARAHSTRYAARFTAVSTLQAAVAEVESRWRRHLPAALVLAACAAAVLALAGPRRTVRVPVGRASVVLVLDHSGSMEATDVQPTRMAAAKRAAQTFVSELPSQVRVGAVAFSSAPDAAQAPTSDRKAALGIVDAQTAAGATATGSALELALQLLGNREATSSRSSGGPTTGESTHPPSRGKRTPAAIVLLSDGAANTGRDPVAVAGEAATRGVPIYTVALGTADATIPNPTGSGLPVPVPPDPELLERIAQTSHGRAFTAQDQDQLISIYRRLGSQLGSVPRSRDVTPVFAIAAAALLVSAGLTALHRGGGLP